MSAKLHGNPTREEVEFARSLDMMTTADRWPLIDYLPVKRPAPSDLPVNAASRFCDLELGVLYRTEQNRAAPVVVLTDMYGTRVPFSDAPRKKYATLLDLLNDGWRVD